VSNSPVYNTGRRLGKGGFGQVFLGTRSQKSRSAKDNKPVEVTRVPPAWLPVARGPLCAGPCPCPVPALYARRLKPATRRG
jgi:serine/threonine protein kinase